MPPVLQTVRYIFLSCCCYLRDGVLAWYMLWPCLCVCPSQVTVLSKQLNIVMQTTPRDSIGTLVFFCQGSLLMRVPNAGVVGKFFSTSPDFSQSDAILPKVCVYGLWWSALTESDPQADMQSVLFLQQFTRFSCRKALLWSELLVDVDRTVSCIVHLTHYIVCAVGYPLNN